MKLEAGSSVSEEGGCRRGLEEPREVCTSLGVDQKEELTWRTGDSAGVDNVTSLWHQSAEFCDLL